MIYAVAALIFITVFILVISYSYISSTLKDNLNRHKSNIRALIDRSLSAVKKSEIIKLEILLAVLSILLIVVTGEFLILAVAIPVVIIAPKAYISIKEKKYFRYYYEGLTGFLESVVSGLKAGLSISKAFVMFSEKDKSPVGREISVVMKEIQLGKSMSAALEDLSKRIPLKENEIIMSAVITSLETGGNITQVLENILVTIREREELNREVETLTSQGVMSGLIVGLLPVFMAVIISILDPEFIAPLFNTTIGMTLVAAAIVMELIGAVMIRKIVKIN